MGDAAEPPEPPAGGTPSGLGNVPGMLTWLHAELAPRRGGPPRTTPFPPQGLSVADANDRYLRHLLGWNLAVGTLLQGRVADAEATLGELAADPWATRPHRYFAVHAYYMLAQVQRVQGRLGAALRSCRQGSQL